MSLFRKVVGEGDPIVFIHGFTLDLRMWDDQVPAFAGDHRVVRYDARGFGRSPLPNGPYSHDDDLRELLDELSIDRAVIVGLSMGGGIAADFALTYPERTRALVLVDAALSGFDWSQETNAGWRHVGPLAREVGVDPAKRAWLDTALFAPARRQPAVAARLAEMVGDYSGYHWLHRSTQRTIEPLAFQRVEQLAMPTLVVVGEEDLPDFVACADAVATRAPNARRVVLRGAGHMSNMEDHAGFNRALRKFLSSL